MRCETCGHVPSAHDVSTGRCLFEPGGTFKSGKLTWQRLQEILVPTLRMA
jgi:hypothetical protein